MRICGFGSQVSGRSDCCIKNIELLKKKKKINQQKIKLTSKEPTRVHGRGAARVLGLEEVVVS